MKKLLLMLSLMVTALISVQAQTSDNAKKYALGGNLQDANLVNYIADEKHLFSYDEATGLWTKTVTVEASKIENGYFRIQTSDNEKWWSGTGWTASFKVTGDMDFVEIKSGATANSFFNLDNPGERTVTFTIKEEGGKVYLKISGLDPVEANDGWAVNGTMTSGQNIAMTAGNGGEYSYSLGNVSASDTFNIIYLGDTSASWGATYTLGNGESCTLQEGGTALKFDGDYTNASIIWNPSTHQLSFSGEAKLDENEAKYAFSGCLDGVSLVSKYTADADHLFSYDKQTGEWTKTGTISQNTNHYFAIWNSGNKRLGPKGKYSLKAEDMDFTELATTFGNIEITGVDKDYQEVTFTIKEIDGVAYLKISGFSTIPDTPGVVSWTVDGTLTNGQPAEMTSSSDGSYTYSAASVSKDATFSINMLNDGVVSATYGGGAAEVKAGNTYTLVQNGVALKFDADYTNVTLTWNSKTFELKVSGTPVSSASGNAKKYSLGGNLEVMPAVFKYSEDLLFNYDEATATWTKDINTAATDGSYFEIYDSTGQRWIFADAQAVQGNENKVLTAATYYHNEFKGSGEYTFTITETDGIPYLKITKLNESEKPLWYIIGKTLTNNLEQQMLSAGDKLTYKFSEVNEGDEFRLVNVVEGVKKYYGTEERINAGESYAISTSDWSFVFGGTYKDVQIILDIANGKLSFTGMVTTGAGELRPSATSPANNSTVLSVDKLSQITFTFNQFPNGINDIFRTAHTELTIFKDGQPYRVISTAEVKNVCLNRNNPSVLEINFDPITEAGIYSMVLPQDFIRMDTSTGGVLEGDDSSGEAKVYKDSELQNAPYNLTFTIKSVLDFSITPAPGEVYVEDLVSLTIKYPKDAVVTVNNSASSRASLIYIDETAVTDAGVAYQKKETHTYYNVTAQGNVVTLTAVQPAAISENANKKNARYYQVSIPASLWSVEYEGNTETFSGRSYSGYTILKKVQENPEVPFIIPGNAQEMKAEELQTVKVQYPEGYKFNEWTASNPFGKKVGYTVGYLRKTIDANAEEGTNIGSYTLSEIDIENRSLTLSITLNEDVTEVEDGYYCIMLVNQMFVLEDNSKSVNLYFPGYKVNKNASDVESDLDAFNVEKIVYEHNFDAVSRSKVSGYEYVIDFEMHPLFISSDNHFGRTTVSIAPAEEYAQIVNHRSYKAPEATSAIVQTEANNGYVGVNAFSAGVYEIKVGNFADGTFKDAGHTLTATVRPSIESLEVTVNSVEIKANETGDSYILLYDPTLDKADAEWSSSKALIEVGNHYIAFPADFDSTDETEMAAHKANCKAAMQESGVKFYFRYTESAVEDNATRADNSDIAGFMENGSGNYLDLQRAAENGGFDFIVEENGIRSKQNHVSVEKSNLSGVDSIDGEQEVVWYDLMGNRVSNPSKGIFIRVCGGKATKHMLR